MLVGTGHSDSYSLRPCFLLVMYISLVEPEARVPALQSALYRL